jgi:hypothetical protein
VQSSTVDGFHTCSSGSKLVASETSNAPVTTSTPPAYCLCVRTVYAKIKYFPLGTRGGLAASAGHEGLLVTCNSRWGLWGRDPRHEGPHSHQGPDSPWVPCSAAHGHAHPAGTLSSCPEKVYPPGQPDTLPCPSPQDHNSTTITAEISSCPEESSHSGTPSYSPP